MKVDNQEKSRVSEDSSFYAQKPWLKMLFKISISEHIVPCDKSQIAYECIGG